jgi:hypothetical protein
MVSPPRGSTRARIAYSLAAGAVASAAAEGDAVLVHSGPQNLAIGSGFSLNLKIDGDSFGDVTLKNYVFSGTAYHGAAVNFFPGKVVGFSVGPIPYVSALSPGFTVSASTVGPSFYGAMSFGANTPNAQFNNAPDAYVGLSFPIAGNTHYGWVRVAVNNALGTFVVKDWAYESAPGVGATIVGVPEAGTLGVLAAGAAGVLLLRRREREVGEESACVSGDESAS